MFCVKCGTQLPDAAEFCLKCGAPQGKVRVTANQERALFELQDGDKYCIVTNRRLVEGEKKRDKYYEREELLKLIINVTLSPGFMGGVLVQTVADAANRNTGSLWWGRNHKRQDPALVQAIKDAMAAL